jgi:hypothetical protein
LSQEQIIINDQLQQDEVVFIIYQIWFFIT